MRPQELPELDSLVGRACTVLFMVCDAVAAGDEDAVERAKLWGSLCRRVADAETAAGNSDDAALWRAHAARVEGVTSLGQLTSFTRERAMEIDREISGASPASTT
jgi:hypothetical protein